MDYGKLFKVAKKLYKKGEIQKVKDWPTTKEMRKMKGKVVIDAPLTGKPGTSS